MQTSLPATALFAQSGTAVTGIATLEDDEEPGRKRTSVIVHATVVGSDVAVGQPIRDLQEVTAMFATKFQEYSRRLKEEGLEEGLEKGREAGLSEGLGQGRTEGRTAERIAIARRLLERGETVEEVAAVTGLSPHDVAHLAD